MTIEFTFRNTGWAISFGDSAISSSKGLIAIVKTKYKEGNPQGGQCWQFL